MILLLGGTGYIGEAFAAELHRRGLVFQSLTRGAVDYTRFDVLFHYVRTARPEFIINAAGYPGNPDVDACEIHRADSVRANTLLPQTIARVCYLTKTPWGHVSSGCIYSGAKVAQNGGQHVERDLNRPEVRRIFDAQPDRFSGFVESDEPNFSFRAPPCSFYSGTKALAEEALRWFNRSYIWRPGLVFDEYDHPRNHLSKIQRCTRIHDGVNPLSHRGDFVQACLDLWERRAPFATYNIVNPGAITGRQVVQTIQRVFKPERQFGFWNNDEEFYRSGGKALRSNCILDVTRLHSTGIKTRPVKEAIEDSLAKWRPLEPGKGWEPAIRKTPGER